MDMDDPWGSPWADEIPHPLPSTANKGKDNGEVRPETPVKASTLGSEVRADSPWDDEDDGFGDWAAVPEVEGKKGDGLGFDGAGDAWETRDDRVGLKSELNGLDLSWNDSIPTIHEVVSPLAPSLMSESAEIVREPSPDPWAAETTLKDEHPEDTTKLDREYEPSEVGMEELIVETPNNAVLEEAGPHEEALPRPAETVRDESKTTDESEGWEATSEEQAAVLVTVEKVEEEENDAEAGQESSRPSSSRSDQSHHDPLTESPRTSLDEEPRRPQVPRKVSSKIQERVEHFEGLAKQEEELMIEPSRNQSRSNIPSAKTEQILEEPDETNQDVKEDEEGEEYDDFGDFEDGQSDSEELVELQKTERPVTPVHIQSQTASSPPSKMSSTQAQASPPRGSYEVKDYGRVKYQVDASALHNFTSFGGDDSKDAPVERVFIMDTIPYDSFASMEERKTWYRISRYGSLRKHNSGDDENYVRVTWSNSQVRDGTLKTVGRWMEEDRISGRVVLGGGSKGSSIFGWGDVNTPAVPLDSVFAARRGKKTIPVEASVKAPPEVSREWPKGLVRDRSNSKSRSPPKAKRQSSSKSASIPESHGTSTEVPVANFGWNSSPTIKSQPTIPLTKSAPKAAPVPMIPMISTSPPLHTKNPPPAASRVLMPVETTHLEKAVGGNGLSQLLASKPVVPSSLPAEDDDWGEMVASPVVASSMACPMALPPSKALPHNNPQSLTSAFSPPPQPSPIEFPTSQFPLPRGQRPATSFDDILAPMHRVSLESKSDPFLPSAFSPTSSDSFFNATVQKSAAPAIITNTSTDPSASADFSFFDSPAPAPKPASLAAPTVKPSVSKSISLAKVPPAPSPLRNGKTRQEIEQEEVVAGIVKSLPDLSYMLRR